MVGVSFTELTVRTKLSLRVALLPSLTVNVTVAVPDLFATGVILTVRLLPLPPRTILPTGSNVLLLVLRVTANEPSAVSTSVTVKLTVLATSSFVD